MSKPSTTSINTESLALSASLFTSSIASWLPTNFGISQSDQSKAETFDAALRESRGERLGLGHPSLGLGVKRGESSRSGAGAAGAGLVGLSRKLGKQKRDEELLKSQGRDVDEEKEEEEEESRASLGKAKKKAGRAVIDPFASKKKKKVASPLVKLSKPPQPQPPFDVIPSLSPSTSKSPAENEGGPASASTAEREPSPALTPLRIKASSPVPSPLPLDGPMAPGAKRNRDESADEEEKEEADFAPGTGTGTDDPSSQTLDGDGLLSTVHAEAGRQVKASLKTQQRREKRKRAKLAKST